LRVRESRLEHRDQAGIANLGRDMPRFIGQSFGQFSPSATIAAASSFVTKVERLCHEIPNLCMQA
jgi:hypothetical protein